MARSAPASDRDSSRPMIPCRKQQLRPDPPNLQAVPPAPAGFRRGHTSRPRFAPPQTGPRRNAGTSPHACPSPRSDAHTGDDAHLDGPSADASPRQAGLQQRSASPPATAARSNSAGSSSAAQAGLAGPQSPPVVARSQRPWRCPRCATTRSRPAADRSPRAEQRSRPASAGPIFRLGLYFNPLISWHEAPRNSGNCAQLLATIEQSADRRPRQLTVEAGLIESEKLGISERYFVPSSEAVAFRKSV